MLAAAVVDQQEDTSGQFARDDLRDLFSYKTDTASETHAQLKCKKCVGGVQVRRSAVAGQDEAAKEDEQVRCGVVWS